MRIINLVLLIIDIEIAIIQLTETLTITELITRHLVTDNPTYTYDPALNTHRNKVFIVSAARHPTRLSWSSQVTVLRAIRLMEQSKGGAEPPPDLL